MSDHIRKLISEGEHQTLDFKFEISDFAKIARTLVAFANTDGGRLLVGVKDNGAIAGIRTDEEYYMVEGAARLYCRPEVPVKLKQWNIEGRTVLEVIIQPGRDKPYRARDDSDHWVAYIRQGDENFRAGRLRLKLWEREKRGEGTFFRFGHPEKILLQYLQGRPWVTVQRFRRLAGISKDEAEDIMISFIMLGIIEPEHIEQDIIYRFRDGYEKILEGLDEENQK